MSIEVKDGVIFGNVHSGDIENTTVTNINQYNGNNGDVKVDYYGLRLTRNGYFIPFYIIMTLMPALLIWLWMTWKDTGNGIAFAFGCVNAAIMIALPFEAKMMNKKFLQSEAEKNN